PAARAPDVDSLGFQAMDRNVPGLSNVILQKLNMKSYEDYKSAMDGRKTSNDFGIRTYFDMFQKMEDTFKFCVECKKLPDALPDPNRDIPFPTDTWTKPAWDVKGWEDWFSMQEQVEEKLREPIRRLVAAFHSRPLTIGLGLRLFGINPHAKALTVHVVGASHVETLNTRPTDYDELTRMFPGHQGVEVVMVGVDVVDGPIM
ncbi:PREDICTED: putative protein MSS51 homolog, mitochondrial, partial [Apaloderma vittatum]|uniref:putative protein MSS51 homolog, mitochondrial n=1 Tax=Apaloderma vittatum TaxID=57397 RepID=UPI000521C603